jgi:hypothetical protein
MTTETSIAQRVYLNSFPKAGTHLAELMVRQLAAPLTERPWLGNLTGNAWTNRFAERADLIPKLCEKWPSGAYLKGHMGYNPDIAEALYLGKISTIFVYRNLRSVAVSTMYHLLDERKNDKGEDVLKHPNKELYRSLPNKRRILAAVIAGLGLYPGIAERWRMFKPWLSERWVLPVRFEDMRLDTAVTASLMLRYVGGQAAAFHGHHLTIDRQSHDETVAAMVQATKTQHTSTKRRGSVDGWRDYFTPEIERLWHSTGAYAENEALGYE